MKKQKKFVAKQLTLKIEHIRLLSTHELPQIGGGVVEITTSTTCSGENACTGGA